MNVTQVGVPIKDRTTGDGFDEEDVSIDADNIDV